MSARATQLAFVAVGAAHIAVGLVMLFAPGPFYDGIATFPPRNDHFTRDLSTFYLALGIVFALAARRASWRAPVLLLAVIEYALHIANHLYDFGDPPDAWVAPVTTAVLAAGLALLVLLAYAAMRRRRPAEPGPRARA
jgi:hypothetical protein